MKVHLLLSGGEGDGDGVSDVFQAALQSPDTRPQVSSCAPWWRGEDGGGDLPQSCAQVLPLGVQAEVAGGTGVAGGEGQAVTTSAGVTAASGDAAPTQTGPRPLVAALWKGSLRVTEARWEEDNTPVTPVEPESSALVCDETSVLDGGLGLDGRSQHCKNTIIRDTNPAAAVSHSGGATQSDSLIPS